MIRAVMLCHPQSADLLPMAVFRPGLAECIRISCGTTRMQNVDYSESNDFFPTYASWNSAIFETSVILTVWEHADQLIGRDDVAIIHSDISIHFRPSETWRRIDRLLRSDARRAVGLVAPATFMGIWEDWLIPADAPLCPRFDPMMIHSFDNGILVWDYIRKYDVDIYEWAMDEQPRLIYSHQFACTRTTFDDLGTRLYDVAHRLRLHDVGLWTPHMFERLVALYLARYGGPPVLTTAFWHYSSSGSRGPGEHNLYGPRPLKFYRICTRWNRQADGDGSA